MGKIIIIILIHLIGDFFLQGNKMSKNKANYPLSLIQHVSIYTLSFVVLSPLVLGLTIQQGLIYSLLNGVLHLIVDWGTSKMKFKFWNNNENKYLKYVSLDQILHITILIVTYLVLFPGVISAPTFFD